MGIFKVEHFYWGGNKKVTRMETKLFHLLSNTFHLLLLLFFRHALSSTHTNTNTRTPTLKHSSTQVHTYTHTRAHTHTHTYMHTHTYSYFLSVLPYQPLYESLYKSSSFLFLSLTCSLHSQTFFSFLSHQLSLHLTCTLSVSLSLSPALSLYSAHLLLLSLSFSSTFSLPFTRSHSLSLSPQCVSELSLPHMISCKNFHSTHLSWHQKMGQKERKLEKGERINWIN